MRIPHATRLESAIVLTVFGAVLASCGPTAFSVPSKTGTPSPRQVTQGDVEVRAAHLFTSTSGWVLTVNRLLITGDGGRTWADVTPPSIFTTRSALHSSTLVFPGSAPAPNMFALETAFFLNPSRGWVVRSTRVNMGNDQAPLDLLTTSDGGKHWSAQRMIATISFDTPGPVYLTFVDAMQGWLVIDQGSHSGFMHYTGFRTTNGGQTWSTVSYPQSGPVLFINHLDGFSAAGADGPTSETYVTHDGALSWARLVVPPSDSAVKPLFQMPVFTDDRNGVLAGGVADASGGTAAEVFYTTSDGGRSWSHAATVLNPDPQTSGQLGGVMDRKDWIAAFLGPGPIAGRTYTRLKATQDGGRSWAWTPTVLTGGFNMNEISFAGSTGWAIIVDAGCLGFKTDCFTNFRLFQTVDAGAHWQALSVT